MDKQCKTDGCEAVAIGRGLCPKHYYRLRRHGSPHKVKQVHGGPPEDRFWSKVRMAGPDDCWEWTARSQTSGYGSFQPGGRGVKRVLAHRYSYELANGTIPPNEGLAHGLVVRHVCDNRLCVNPAHLELGTQADNVRDMDRRGGRKTKSHKGEDHPNSKFTESDVLYMRRSTKTNAQIAKELGCHPGTVKNIRLRRSWKHLP